VGTFWLKDESPEDSDNLPSLEVLAQDITENFEAVLELFSSIYEDLKVDYRLANRMSKKALYRHKRSGDLFAIEIDDTGKVLSTSGPLLVKDLNAEELDYDNYWDDDVTAHLNEFVPLSKVEYEELLKRTGFFIQESQRSIFSELNNRKEKKRK